MYGISKICMLSTVGWLSTDVSLQIGCLLNLKSCKMPLKIQIVFCSNRVVQHQQRSQISCRHRCRPTKDRKQNSRLSRFFLLAKKKTYRKK